MKYSRVKIPFRSYEESYRLHEGCEDYRSVETFHEGAFNTVCLRKFQKADTFHEGVVKALRILKIIPVSPSFRRPVKIFLFC